MNKLDISDFEKVVECDKLAVRGLRIFQDNELVASWQPVPLERQNQYSGTKSFTSTACAFAVEEGLFSLEDSVLEHFSADAPEHPSENLQRMQMKHLITMSMGFKDPMLMGAQRPQMKEKDWVKYVLSAPVVHEPGTVFQYNNAGPYLLGMLVQRKSGMSLVDYLMPRLFEPLGIDRPEDEKDPLGNTFGAGGLMLNVDEFAKLGLLYLNEGKYNGKQLISPSWVRSASAPHIQADQGDNEIGQHYGYLFWTMPNQAYRADGKYGQYCIVLPRQKSVIAVNSMQIENEKAVLRAVVRHIIPLL